jgi:hypothetical protein
MASMPPRDAEIARWDRESRRLELRRDPARMRVSIGDLPARDGHVIRCVFTCTIGAVDRPADRRMLEEAFPADQTSVGVDRVSAHFAPSLRTAASGVIAQRAGEDWLSPDHRPVLLDALRRAAEAVAFTSGLHVLGPMEVQTHSPTIERQRQEEMERRLTEQRHAGQAEQLQRAAEMLRRFQALRQTAPELPAGRLLDQFSPADRPALLQTILMASADAAGQSPLMLVAGGSLLRILPEEGAAPHVTALPQTLGPLRSIRTAVINGQSRLLVGARAGVLVLDLGDIAGAIAYGASGIVSAMGFNSVVVSGGRLWASHSGAGIVAWDLDTPGQPVLRISDIDTARHLQQLDDRRLVFASGASLLTLDRDGTCTRAEAGASEIAGLHVADQTIMAVYRDGQVAIHDAESLERRSIGRRCGRISAAAALPWLGDQRLLLASEDGPVFCVGAFDTVTTQYTSPHRGLTAIAATAGYVAAISADRQRIVLWRSWESDTPSELHLGATARARIADLCFG